MTAPHFNRNLFKEADVSDKIGFLNSLIEDGELTFENASAIIHDIHHDLAGMQVQDTALLLRYRAVQQSILDKYPDIFQAVFKKAERKEKRVLPGKSEPDEFIQEQALPSPFKKFLKYLGKRILAISLTIFLGVFITVMLANLGGGVESSIYMEIENVISRKYQTDYWGGSNVDRSTVELDRWYMAEKAGLHLPYLPRQFVLTFRALALDWKQQIPTSSLPGSTYSSYIARDIVLTDMPHTLLLIGTAYFLLFLFGIPISLLLFRKQGKFIDRLSSILAPISSIPAWVIGVILIMLLAVNFKLLPFGGMYDLTIPKNEWDKVGMVLRHMVLPVLAIFLSLIFQYIYSWRTVFLLHSEDDYVDLAKAKGLPTEILDRRYILRPSMPFVVTSFAIMLVSFWQMTTALEKVFNWPGIGRLYILSLPNFLGESFYPGIMSITLSIVVLFAYILGLTVLVLDIVYAMLDPRIRIGGEEQTLKLFTPKLKNQPKKKVAYPVILKEKFQQIYRSTDLPPPLPRVKGRSKDSARSTWKKENRFKDFLREVLHYPSAIFGLAVILILVVGSIIAVTAFPFSQIGEYWYSKALTGRISVPKLAQPSWVNLFRKDPLPSTMSWNTKTDAGLLTSQTATDLGASETYTFNIDYNYGGFPQNLLLYFDETYVTKRPFAFLTWTTPDGRTYDMATSGTTKPVDFATDLKYTKILNQNPTWKNWFTSSGNYPTSQFLLYFADPSKTDATVLKGRYTLTVTTQTFEKDSDVNLELLLIGQVYGYAGTDYLRRDLVVPLLWGMPFALIFGLLGAFGTTVLSMAIAATGVWFGGWVDSLIQRLVEANMVLPIIAISVLLYSYFNASIWVILAVIVLLNVFGSPIKSFRSALLQIKDSPYIEAAKSYGASNFRIITRYLIPSILPTLIPQLVTLIPSFVFLEATLGIFNVRSNYPTWGRIIYDAIRYQGNWGSPFWVLEPISLLLLTGLAFTMLGFALERILNPKLRNKVD